MGKKINLGIVGAGRIGRLHAEVLAYRIADAQVVAVADVNLQAAEKLGAELRVPKVYGDYRPIVQAREIDAVVICSSTDTHAEIIVASARAGKHIFCEKPVAQDLESIDRALKAVADASVKLQIGFNRRFDPSFHRARELVSSGKIGRPHLLRITSRDPGPPPIDYVKVSGGIFLDMAIHDFDMARYMMGCEVQEIYATGAVLVDPEIGRAGDIDTAITLLRFENGALGTIDNSRKAVYGYDQRMEIFGSEGVICVGNHAPDTVVQSDKGGVHSSLPLHFFLERYTESYVEEMRQFVACIIQDSPTPVSGKDGRIPVVMAAAAKRSLAERRPVRLSEIND